MPPRRPLLGQPWPSGVADADVELVDGDDTDVVDAVAVEAVVDPLAVAAAAVAVDDTAVASAGKASCLTSWVLIDHDPEHLGNWLTYHCCSLALIQIQIAGDNTFLRSIPNPRCYCNWCSWSSRPP